MTPKAGDRCLGCGGIASVVHLCGAPLCRACVVQFPKCPKCGEAIAHGTIQPVAGAPSAHAQARPSAAPGGTLGALRGVFHRGNRTPPEPPAAPSPVPRASAARRGPVHRADHEARTKAGARTPPEAEAKPAAKKPAPPPPAKAASGAPVPAKAGPEEGKAPIEKEHDAATPEEAAPPAPAKPRPSKPDDEPRL